MSPLNSTRGSRCFSCRMAVAKRAAPPTGSSSRALMLYTSLKCNIVMLRDNVFSPDAGSFLLLTGSFCVL